MSNALSFKSMGAVVAVAAAMLAGTASPAMARSHPILTGVVAGAAFHKLSDMEAKHKAKKEADAAAGLPAKPSLMGAGFDATLKERLASARAAQAAQSTGQPSFGATFKERLANARAAQAADVERARRSGPSSGP